MSDVDFRRFLALIVFLAVALAPFGRAAVAHAAMAPADQAMAGHCHDTPAPDDHKAGKAIDCTIACAVLVPAQSTDMAAAEPATADPEARLLSLFAGLHPGADPPPPRLS